MLLSFTQSPKAGAMSEYNIGFSKVLIDAAKAITEMTGRDTLESERAALYLCKLSCEITLKALLEKAGKTVKEIRTYSHNLIALQDAFSFCEVEDETSNGSWITANGFRGIVTDKRFSDATIGKILNAEDFGASKYPNQIRYGEELADFPFECWLVTATELISWAQKYYDRIRLKNK